MNRMRSHWMPSRLRDVTWPLLGMVCLVGMPVGAGADVVLPPPPINAEVNPCDETGTVLLCPHGSADPAPALSEFEVILRTDQGDPIPGVFVEVVFENPADLFLCPTAVLTGVTDYNGRAEFNIAGGGCSLAQDAVRIIGNGVPFRAYHRVISPDLPEPGDGVVGLIDFIYFAQQFGHVGDGCTDYDGDGWTGLADFIVFGSAWTRSCQ